MSDDPKQEKLDPAEAIVGFVGLVFIVLIFLAVMNGIMGAKDRFMDEVVVPTACERTTDRSLLAACRAKGYR